MYKAYKFRLYPNPTQKEHFDKIFGCQRFIFNHYLNVSKENNFKNAITYIKDYQTNLKYEKPFLQEIEEPILIKSIYKLESAIKKYQKNISGYPKFKSKFSKISYTISNTFDNYYQKQTKNIKIDLKNKEIILSNLGKIKIKGYRNLQNIPGQIINATISKEPTQKYYISILYKQIDNQTTIVPNTIIGIDLGIKKLLTLSNGITYNNNKYIKKYEKRIKMYQKRLSKKEKRSKNYYKCKEKLAIIYNKLKNARKYYIHKITKQITDTYDIIICESLQTKNMIMKKEISKNITDATFHEIVRQLEYKSAWKNKQFYQINPYYPSSQTCCICGNIDKKYKDLSKREYVCTNCHNIFDRDYNASVNIMFEGLKLYIKNNYKKLKI